jgi:hypothetical protein
MAQAEELRLVQELVERGVPATQAATYPRAFLMARLNMSPATAGRTVRLADALAGPMPATGAALAEGVICLEQAAAIVDTVTGLREHASTAEQEQVEAFLLDEAHSLNASQLRRLDKVLDAVFDPDGAQPREDRARARRGAHLTDHHDGSQTLTWRDTDEVMAKVRAALDPLSAPDAELVSPAARRADAPARRSGRHWWPATAVRLPRLYASGHVDRGPPRDALDRGRAN